MDKKLEIRKKILELAAKIDPRWKDAEVEINDKKDKEKKQLMKDIPGYEGLYAATEDG